MGGQLMRIEDVGRLPLYVNNRFRGVTHPNQQVKPLDLSSREPVMTSSFDLSSMALFVCLMQVAIKPLAILAVFLFSGVEAKSPLKKLEGEEIKLLWADLKPEVQNQRQMSFFLSLFDKDEKGALDALKLGVNPNKRLVLNQGVSDQYFLLYMLLSLHFSLNALKSSML